MNGARVCGALGGIDLFVRSLSCVIRLLTRACSACAQTTRLVRLTNAMGGS